MADGREFQEIQYARYLAITEQLLGMDWQRT